ncbi:MAG: hypothetical protein K2I64_04460 [Muribaculaceae bacterium]|nr:hypothetical protein [Muribaculaceae bacterium]
MKSKSFIVGSIIIFAIGLIVCLIHNNAGVINSLLLITGLLFLIPGVLNLLALLDRRGKEAEKKPSGMTLMISWVSTVAAIILGAMIVITPDSFRSEFLFIVGALLALFAISLIYSMAVNLRAVKLPAWMYVMPGLVLVDGVVLACNFIKHENTQALMMGIGLMVISAAFFVTLIYVGAYNRSQKNGAPSPKSDLPEKV